MNYPVIWEPVAARGLREIMAQDHRGGQRLAFAVAALAQELFPDDSTALGRSGFHRLHVDQYRVLYRIDEPEHAVHVITVGTSKS